MILSGFSSVSGLRAQSLALDVAANNLANVNTAGFKKSSVRLQNTTPSPLSSGQTVGTGVSVGSTPQTFSQGAFQLTGFPSDLAINGSGFFSVQNDQGAVFYTRSGSFVRDGNGFLRTATGEFLLGSGGKIQVPAGAVNFSVDSDGSIRSIDSSGNSATVGTVTLSSFQNPNGLSPIGGNLFAASDAAGTPIEGAPGADGRGSIQSGALEMSNVDIAEEMVNMILAQRSFEANARMITTTDQMLKTITRLRS